MPDHSALDPIAGVSLETFVAVSLELASVQFDSTRAAEIAASQGIPLDRWNVAADGWAERLRSDAVVAAEFSRLYRRS